MTRILIADDDPDLREILRCVLEPAGFEVDEAPTLSTATERALLPIT